MSQMVIILGPPGSGKDTQAKFLEDLGYHNLNIGEQLRELAKTDSSIAAAMNEGGLVEDDAMGKVLLKIISKIDKNTDIISDGSPRNIHQVEQFEQILSSTPWRIYHVFFLELSDEEVYHRLRSRGRSDDQDATIAHRLELYHQTLPPVLDYYAKKGLLYRIDATGSPETVFSRIKAILRP